MDLRYTYPRWLQAPIFWWLWGHICCRHGWHLWDEVSSTGCRYLICDACSEIVYLSDSHAPACAGGVNGRHECSCGVGKD